MRVLRSDLDAVGSSVASAFDSEIADAKKIITVLDNFMGDIGSGTKLTGSAYENIKSQLGEQKALMEKRRTLAESMKESIESAIRSMGDYMGGYSKLDTDDLTEIEASISSAETSISNLKPKLKKTGLSVSDKSVINGEINGYESTLTKLKEEKEKLDKLPAADAAAWGSLESAVTDVSAFSSSSSSV